MKTGWIVEVVNDKFVDCEGNVGSLEQAEIFTTRKLARYCKIRGERVRKVKVGKDGKAIKIIKGR